MQYQPLSQVRETLKVQWYRSRMPPERFRELSRRSDRQGWKQAGGHLALFCLTGLATYVTWAQGLWLLFVVALFCHGTVASFFRGTATHELGHGTVFETRWLNKLFLYLFSLISWWNPFDYAASHTYHHRYTLHPEGDRENLLPLHPNVGRTFLLQLFTINLLTPPGRTFGKGGFISTVRVTLLDAMGQVGSTKIPFNEWLQALHQDQPEQHRRSIWWSRVQLAFHGAVLVLAIATGQWVLPLILTVPSYIANWLSYFVALPQHCGLMENTTDFRKSTRSIRLPKPVEFLYWHMNWHTEHHMYAGIPCYNLPALASEIREDMPEPRSLRGAWREMLDTWERQKADPDYEFDTPLPATAKTQRRKATERDEASIGDLAPQGLQ
ncbi:fatty acid desaturase [Ruegeria sp. 2205SS24-7]|uniref:fatty acid desaturase n=1 Tax=Ruegeria discodermiae TaxID=3064389 RepID=UPI0027415825|nr:fatty acid desaturase [Ruegeria sp. 2205SS24-7]MDP5216245.1 fatty acid desaturase [Ruegeria sp. 2205SS24-7]